MFSHIIIFNSRVLEKLQKKHKTVKTPWTSARISSHTSDMYNVFYSYYIPLDNCFQPLYMILSEAELRCNTIHIVMGHVTISSMTLFAYLSPKGTNYNHVRTLCARSKCITIEFSVGWYFRLHHTCSKLVFIEYHLVWTQPIPNHDLVYIRNKLVKCIFPSETQTIKTISQVYVYFMLNTRRGSALCWHTTCRHAHLRRC